MFGTILTTVYTLLLAYILWRAGTVSWIARRLRRRYLVGIGVLLWALFVVGRTVGHDATGPVAAALELVGMTCLGAVFLVFAPLLVADVVTLFGLVLRRWAPRIRGVALVLGLGLATTALVQGLRPPGVTSHEVTLAELPPELDGTVLVALSDTHLGQILGPGWMDARAKQVAALEPDAVLLVGDIVEGHGAPPKDLVESLARLDAPMGVWFVTGNHEHHGGPESSVGALEAAGFRHLADTWTELRPGLVLAGVDDPRRHGRAVSLGDALERALAGRPGGATVLLSHRPLDASRAASEGVDLMLSGHTHGGQIWPFSHLTNAYYDHPVGRFDVNGMTLVVSRGAGTWGPRMRLWQRGEILRLVLRSPAVDPNRK